MSPSSPLEFAKSDGFLVIAFLFCLRGMVPDRPEQGWRSYFSGFRRPEVLSHGINVELGADRPLACLSKRRKSDKLLPGISTSGARIGYEARLRQRTARALVVS